MDLQPGENLNYELKCRVKVIKQSYTEIADGRLHETKSVILLPDIESTETSRFLATYLPDVSCFCLDCRSENVRIYHTECPECGSENLKREHTEVPSWIAGPVNEPCRLAVLRKNNYCKQHHMFVMSTGVEEILKNMDDRFVNVKILDILQDNVCDTASSVNRTAK